MQRILVLRGGALGDFIVILPALLALRHQWPAARIELAGNAVAADLAVRRGLIDAAHSQHESRWSALYADVPLPRDFATWLGSFDLVVSFWPDPDGDLRRRFPLHSAQRFLSAAANPETDGPAAAHYVSALEPIGIRSPVRTCRLLPTRIVAETAAAAPRQDDPVAPIALHPGSGSRRKNWPAERWLDVIDRVPGKWLIVLGPAEQETWAPAGTLGKRLTAPDPKRPGAGRIEFAANLPLSRLVDELSRCHLFLGHDAGVSHLAAACGVPSVLLFGPTDPARWAPPAPFVRVLRQGDDLAAIPVDEVVAAVNEVGRLQV